MLSSLTLLGTKLDARPPHCVTYTAKEEAHNDAETALRGNCGRAVLHRAVAASAGPARDVEAGGGADGRRPVRPGLPVQPGAVPAGVRVLRKGGVMKACMYCGKPMNPVDLMVSSGRAVCGRCVRAQHQAAVAGKKFTPRRWRPTT